MKERARLAGIFYVLTIVAGMIGAFTKGLSSDIANAIAATCYVAVTLILYAVLKPVSRTISMLAVFFGLLGCLFSVLDIFHLNHTNIETIVFFGVYCVLVGYLILRSSLMPHVLGVLMMITGAGWLTYLSASLAHRLSPYQMVTGLLGEGALALWLLVFGVNGARWQEQTEQARR